MSGRRPGPAGAIEPLATLPVFLKLQGRRVLLAGGTAPAVWKAELLAAAGAAVDVVAEAPCAEMEALCTALPERLTLHRRAWTTEDLAGAAVAIGAFEEGEAGERFRQAARAAGVPVNVIDVPPLCDFQFGTIVARSPLVIGISTDGAAPVLGQALRARIEALLPAGMGAWALAAKAWREPLQALKLGFAARRRFWELFADTALEGGERAPDEADRLRCMAAAEATERAPTGRILLVGAGPGPAAEVTLGAVRALQSADVILHEAGVAAGVLGLGRREARREPASRDADATAATALALAAEGRTVAWVGPGNPGAPAPGEPAPCLAWAARAARLQAGTVPVEAVRGLRCAACPAGCAAQA